MKFQNWVYCSMEERYSPACTFRNFITHLEGLTKRLCDMHYIFYRVVACLAYLTLFQAVMGKFYPHHHRSLMTFWWKLQRSLYSITLFLWTFYSSHRGQFSKTFWKWKIKKKKISVPTPKEKKWKKILKIIFFKKKSCVVNQNLNSTCS